MEMESFGKYLLLERLAAGGMAEVYLAKLTAANGINKFVAIKRILPQYSDNVDFIDMFKEEAKIAVNLNHSNIVSIYDFGMEKQQFFLVMEFVEGQNLRQILNHMKKESKDLSLDQIVYVIKEVAAGLDHAHRCLDGATGRPLNITHRDMSPQNVMISFEGEVKIVDFGIAKAETQMEHTRAGTIKGKFGYMSPEQADGMTVDPRTDIFSIGIVLWELLAKDRLFTGQNEAATLKKVRECPVPTRRNINPVSPPELERICMKALAKDKSLRYQTAAAFHKDLNRFLNTQFPEFSAQEFSKFMKSLYHKMYLENRRKLADAAKIIMNAEPDKTLVTATATLTSTMSTPSTSLPSVAMNSPTRQPAQPAAVPQAPVLDPIPVREEQAKLGIDMHSQRIDLNALKSSESVKRPYVRRQTQTQTGTRSSQGTQTGIRTGTQSRILISTSSQGNSMLWGFALILTLLSGGYFYVKHNHLLIEPDQAITATPPRSTETNPSPSGQIESSSHTNRVVPINIQSRPQGAVVYVNGTNVGITPYVGHIEANQEFHLAIRKDGYIIYDRPTEKAVADIYRLEAALQPEPPMGYLAIEVYGGGADPIVTVNGQRIEDKSQLTRYPVPAGSPIKIRAVNPFAQAAAEETVTVGQSQKKSVRLILNRTAKGSSP